jgi:hypothetical protein
MNTDNTCVRVNSLCLTYDCFGNCLTCYPNYKLSDGVCLTLMSGTVVDPGCVSWDWTIMSCMSCSSRYVLTPVEFSNSMYCKKVDDLCLTWDNTTAGCISCFSGYFLYKSKCIVYKNTNCRTWDENGYCSSCYNGYMLSVGNCLFRDMNCMNWN